jgi:hypothetical protein
MSFDQVLKLSTEWLLTKPLRERTFAEYANIVDHFATVYGIPADGREGVRQAYMRLPDWQKAR